MCGLVARWLTFSGVRPVRAQPTGSPSRTTKMGWRIRLRGLPAASTVVAVQDGLRRDAEEVLLQLREGMRHRAILMMLR
jgi:hypothetical protein